MHVNSIVNLYLYVIFLNTIIIFSGCEDDFLRSQSITDKISINSASASNPSNNDKNTTTYSETFVTDPFQQKQNKKVDIMFVVDRSESMESEMRSVKNNLSSLFNQLNSQASTKIALMTKIGFGSLAMQPPAGIPVTTINRDVKSNNSLLHVSNYITNSNQLFLQENFLIQASYPPIELDVPSSEWFFREDSLKVFVVVSDDDTFSTFGSIFILHIKTLFDPSLQSIMFFGFVYLTGIQNRITNFNAGDVKIHQSQSKIPSCRGVIGQNYYNMLKNNHFLDEALYDICEKNWELNFSNIAENVIEKFNPVRSFLLQKTAISIDYVKVDDQNVDQSKYSLENNRLVFVEEFLEIDREQTIEVIYTIKAPDQ